MYVVSSDAQYKVSSGYTYDTTTSKYTIDENDSYVIWDYVAEDVLAILDTHRYTCGGTANTCSNLNYALHQQDEYGVSVLGYQLKNGSSLENDLTFPNTADHILKFQVDYWYQKNILPYDSYVEDSIYCNDRIVTEGFSLNNQRKQYLHFRQHDPTTDLDCPRVADRFSVSNPQAQLTYKVALPTAPEMKLLNNSKARSSGSQYWLMSPYSFRDKVYINDLINIIESDGDITYTAAYDESGGIRPVITLIPGLEFSSGEGSMEDPYIVSTN